MIPQHNKPEKSVAFESLFQEILSNLTSEERQEIDPFLEQTKEKIKQWQQQFEEGSLTLAGIKWLLYSEKELLSLKTFEVKGLSTQKIKALKENIITQLLNTLFNTN